jgi:hypothetical protein
MLDFFEIDIRIQGISENLSFTIHDEIAKDYKTNKGFFKKINFLNLDTYTFIENNKFKKISKKVTFDNKSYIYMIPYYYEIIDSLDDIWWNNDDFSNATYEASKKIKNLLDIHPLMTINQAKKILYNPISYDENNFKD